MVLCIAQVFETKYKNGFSGFLQAWLRQTTPARNLTRVNDFWLPISLPLQLRSQHADSYGEHAADFDRHPSFKPAPIGLRRQVGFALCLAKSVGRDLCQRLIHAGFAHFVDGCVRIERDGKQGSQ